jgi:hypothetical protein
MATDSHRLTPAERSELVAYLDGELDEATALQLAEKLTHSVSGRREIDLLRRTWEMLDHLPRPEATPELKERTLSMTTMSAAAGGQIGASLAEAARKAGRWAVVVACLAASFAVAYIAARWVYPDRTRALARDLTIAERLDAYEAVGSIEFLRALDDSTHLDDPASR